MRIFRLMLALASAVTLGVLASCASAPETGRSQAMLIGSAQEARMGFQAFDKMKRSKPIVRSGKDQSMVQRVGRRISTVAELPYAEWEFVLFKDDKTPNAFALPGGKVGIFTGILPITKDEAGLATVMGHEVAHAVARHGAERMSHSLMIQMGGVALSSVLGSSSALTKDLAMQVYGLGTSVTVALPYSRTQELEADHLGLLYMARAGYDPRQAVAFWQRFAAYGEERGGKPPEFLSTHPLDSRRIARLQKLMPTAMAEYERSSRR